MVLFAIYGVFSPCFNFFPITLNLLDNTQVFSPRNSPVQPSRLQNDAGGLPMGQQQSRDKLTLEAWPPLRFGFLLIN